MSKRGKLTPTFKVTDRLGWVARMQEIITENRGAKQTLHAHFCWLLLPLMGRLAMHQTAPTSDGATFD
eukprot:6184245-Pleurochrysis_carterae.AAC.1